MASRLRRTLLAALVTAAVTVPVSAAARPAAVPAPAPVTLAPLTAAELPLLGDRFAAGRADIRAAAETATAHGDQGRAARLRVMADPARHFLSFDGRDGGRTAEVFGDLARAERIAVLVPGSDTNLDTYERFRAGAVALHDELGGRAAVVAWLGYATPGTISPEVLTEGRADDAGAQLQNFVRELKGAKPGSRVSLLCHSYGSVVCGRAAPSLDVADIALYGSPGAGADNVADLHTPATVWAGRGSDDWIAHVPHVRLDILGTTLGLGADPVSDGFGARTFAAGDGGHSDYLKPGSVSLKNLARIALGRATEVTHA
ncbi:alpha/beta hydrolase [Streptomyces sp. NPDC002730]|uniref:alpha/beta hydrolase n=1 Tax=Streptomyces sp. NPDC002730 TaxID=3364662 RepID=UPI0036A50FF4